MSKKIIGLAMATVLMVSLAGCGNKEEQKTTEDNKKQAEVNIDNGDTFKNLKGDWIKDFTHKEFVDKSNELMDKIEDQTKEFDLDYKKDDKVKQVNGTTANVKSIYLDNKDPEANKLESMQFESQLFGENQNSGRIQLKLSLKFDGKTAIKDDKFNLGDTSIAKYASIMTGVSDRDYKDINKKILDIIKNGNGEGVMKDDINGLSEEFAVSKEYIVYTLSTKVYKFVKDNEGIK